MGSKKHKKHHKSEKKDSNDDRQEKPLKLVLKVGGSVQSPVHHPSNSNSSSSPRVAPEVKTILEESRSSEKASHSHEKHKKSKKKKKKKSMDKDKERHERKRKHHHHHHHHREHSHERKEKRRKEQDGSRLLPEAQDSRDSLPVRAPIEHLPVTAATAEKPSRDARSCTLKKKVKSPLQILLLYLLKKLQLKDPQEFFAWPVTDVIAPGYSSIIPNPTDFSTINRKIDDREYKTVAEFKLEIKLMCDNAMTYNRPDTIYYKSAKKMLHGAQKMMSRDQLIQLKRSFPHMSELTVDELGFSLKDECEESLPRMEIAAEPTVLIQPEAKKSKVAPCWNATEPDDEDDDDLTAEEILEQAQKAAKAAADRLTLRRPNCKFGFLRQNENGTTTLSVIHPKSGDKEMKVNLEMLTGKITQGTGTIAGYKEDTKNIIKPIHYNNYGSYSSYAPHFDSTFSNLSKEESDLVLSTYGEDLGVQYAESLTNFARGSDYMMRMVDNLLDSLTGGEHSKTVKILEEKRLLREEETQARQALKPLNENEINKAPPVANHCNQDLESLQALEDIEMELSRLENADEENKKVCSGEQTNIVEKRRQLLVQRRAYEQKLEDTTQLLHELQKVQNERLAANPPPHLGLVRQPSALEHDLAERVTKKLIDVSSQLPPGNIVSVKGLRKAMGITYHPINQTPRNATKITEAAEADSSMDAVSLMDTDSPPDATADNRHRDVEMDLQDFLDSGPILRLSGSPT